jgi:hypothetical protein
MNDPRIAAVLQLFGRWYTKAAELNLAVLLILYIVGCVVAGHPLSIHGFERFVHHTFDFNPKGQLPPQGQ